MSKPLPGALGAYSIAGSLAAATLCASTALAGAVDSPLPVISTTANTRSLYIVPGVTKNNSIETEFSCTSTDLAPVRVAVEIFDASGVGPLNDVAVGSADGAADLLPGGTVTIGTGNTVGIHETKIISFASSGVRNVKSGSARIVATSRRVLCTAFIVDDTTQPVTSMATLKVFGRKRQNGD